MSRFYLRLILIATALFAIVLILIHAQPYDDHELRQLLLPEGCPAPCFMGIRPGVTTVDEAIKILEANEWAEKIDNEKYERGSGLILWNWNNRKPSWIKENLRGSIFIDNKLVQAITIYSKFSLGETRLLLGLPDMDIVSPPQDPSEEHFQYEAYYAQYVIRSRQPCHITEPLLGSVEIQIQSSKYYTTPKHVNFLNGLFKAC